MTFPWTEQIDNIVSYKDSKSGKDFEPDLNVRQNFSPVYDVVLSQALLEHVSNPFMVIQNFIDLTKAGGIIVIHTVNPKFPYHAFPIDCLRFYRDWFFDLENYLPLKVVDFLEADQHLFCVFKKLED